MDKFKYFAVARKIFELNTCTLHPVARGVMWAEKDSNLRTRERTDLQSVAFSHSAIYPSSKSKTKNQHSKTTTTQFYFHFSPLK